MSLLDRTVEQVARGPVFDLLPDATQTSVRALTDADVADAAHRALIRPMDSDPAQAARMLLNPCLAVQWLEAFEQAGLPRALRVFEPCSGGSEPVVLAADIYSGGTGDYTTINLNRPLAAELRGKVGKVRMPVRIIEDNTLRAGEHLEPGTFDVACFHHAINDILQTAVSEPRGMDTTTVDWWPNEMQMIRWLVDDAGAGRLGDHARPALLGAVEQAIRLVGPGGWLLFDHWTWETHRRAGWFGYELFCELIPMARAWIVEAGLPVEERAFEGRDPRWWMGLRVTG